MKDRAAWLAERKTGIGGSDIAALLGLSPWKTAVDVWLDKTGQTPDAEENEPMYWGSRLEDVVASEFAKRNGMKVQRVNSIIRHPEHSCAMASIDRAIVADGTRARLLDGLLVGATALLECKTASAHALSDWQGDDGSDAMPIHYAAQCMWYLAVTDVDVCHVAALVGGNRFIVRKVERDEPTIDAMLERAEAWWQRHIVDGVRPEPESGKDAATLFQSDNGQMIAIDDDTELLVLVNELRLLREQAKGTEQHIEAIESHIKASIGEASGLSIGGKPAITWKASENSAKTDWQAVAKSLCASPEVIARHTQTVIGSRRFIVK